jgi:DNA-binding transcriptional ArsR family regulator
MTADPLDPLIHSPARLRIVATLAALPGGDGLSLTRLQDMLGLAPGHLMTGLRTLEDAGYVRAAGCGASAAVLTRDGWSALDRYAAVLRQPPARAAGEDHRPPRPGLRIGDADRDATAAVLGEHFAHGRLTLDELDARLDDTFAATTRGELSAATRDLPDVTVFLAPPPFTAARRDRARRGRRPGPGPFQRPSGRTGGDQS